ncbi:MAG: YdcF family protein [Chthoniobacter sp.]
MRTLLFLFGAFAGLLVLGTAILILSGLRDDLGPADVALVLGNTVQPDGTPSPRLRARLDKTLKLYRAGYFPRIIASGGVGKEGYDEAVVMRDYLADHGVPRDHIIVDSGGTTTFASARNTRRIAREQHFASVFVVSQYFHIPRSRLALQRFGFSTVHSAHANYVEARDIYSAPRELFGYVRYLFRSDDATGG